MLDVFGYRRLLVALSIDNFASWPTLIASITHVDQVDAWFARVKAFNAGSTVVGTLLSISLLANGGQGMTAQLASGGQLSSDLSPEREMTHLIQTPDIGLPLIAQRAQ